jgi:alpha-galactosidase
MPIHLKPRRLALLATASATLLTPILAAQSPQLAPTPPMGWNSWDSYGLTITESQFRANTDWFNQHLKPSGWQYVVVDEGWYLATPENAGKPGAKAGYKAPESQGYTLDANGRYMPASNRFPSAGENAGFKPLADYVHSLGLKFGIHIIRGIPREAVDKNLPIAGSSFHAADAADTSDTCRWNPDNYGLKANEAAQAYYDSVAKLYASWGLDFIKVDCISYPYKDDEIRMMRQALDKSGRPIVLSLSPGPTPVDKAGEAEKYAQMWRISDDFWDDWKKPDPEKNFPQSLLNQFQVAAAWAPHVTPGHWPDADMLPIGRLGPIPGWGKPRQSHFTHDEQHTLLTLWSIFRSPLVIGANLTEMDPWTEALLTNPEVIAVNQHSTGNKPVLSNPTTIAWSAQPDSGSGHYLAVFNISDQQQTVELAWKDVGLDQAKYKVRDLWQRKNLGTAKSLHVALEPHASALYKLE